MGIYFRWGQNDAEQDTTDLDDSDPNSDIDEAVLSEEEPL